LIEWCIVLIYSMFWDSNVELCDKMNTWQLLTAFKI